MPDQTNDLGDVGLKYISTKASPICSKKHYRIYMINSLPKLKVLDNLAIRRSDRDRATETYSENFEHLPYKRKSKESVVRVLEKRETRSSKWKSQSSYTRSLCAARMGSSAWPLLHSIPSFSRVQDEGRSLSPRQFEYHPLDPSLMVYGTLDGEVVVLNHESGKILRYIPSHGAQSSILGLCWLRTYPSMVRIKKKFKLPLFLMVVFSLWAFGSGSRCLGFVRVFSKFGSVPVRVG